MKQKNPRDRRARFKAILIFLACTATAMLTLSAALLFRLFFADAFARSEILTVPDLTGSVLTGDLPRETEGFQVVRIDQYDDAPIGTVLWQSPAAGSNRKSVPGKRYVTLTLHVSKGRETETVPSVVGSSVESAACRLLSCGFSYERIERYDNAPVGEVIAQSHTAGTALPKGETVTLTVSKGTKNHKVQVPLLSGLSIVEAKSLTEALGLRVGRISYRTSESDEDRVLTQFPLPGARAPAGTEIALTIARRPPETTETLPQSVTEDEPPEASEPGEEETREPHGELREHPHENKEQDPRREPAETNDNAFDRILDRLFEKHFSENSQSKKEIQQ